MQVFVRHSFGGAAAILLTAIANAAPVSLDTEQKAAAGVSTAMFMSEVPRQVNGVLIDDARDYAHFTLREVNAATTPETLIVTQGAITINCSISGSLEARMADVLPRVLRVRYNDCVTSFRGTVRTLNGPVAITLPADTFEPQNVLAIRLGNATEEFLQQWRIEMPEQIDDITHGFDIALRGDIGMTRRFNCCGNFIGSSAFEIHGYSDDRKNVQFPSGAPAVFIGYKAQARQVAVIRSTSGVDGADEDDTRFLSGSVSFTSTQPFYGVVTNAYKFNDYGVHRLSDYVAWTDRLTVNGRINVTWGQWAGAGCMNGVYALRTRVPLIIPLNTPLIDSGELVINGSVVASFYSSANTPPALPVPQNGMLLSMRLRDVGTFNYDAASWFEAASGGQCWP